MKIIFRSEGIHTKNKNSAAMYIYSIDAYFQNANLNPFIY